jgi:hypothetical protein
MCARSTQPKKEPECSMESNSNLDDGIRTYCIYAALVDAGQIYTDQRGRFQFLAEEMYLSWYCMNTMGMH